ncbi:MAG: ATP-grasp domain-containing protein [Candidatus Pacebacteria bacterium]|nr:ATP-grasp domain-containing protein [Candidatus Paceibacterota bacterium]
MIKVGVIRGGISGEHDISLASGAQVLSHLRSDKMNEKYIAIDIFIDKDGVWHINGIPVTLAKVAPKVDVIINALHGDFGEDGKVQQLLEQWGIPYTGSGPLASALGYNKHLSKLEFEKLGIKTPKHILFPAYQADFDARPTESFGQGPRNKYAAQKAREVWGKFSPPWIVKPLTGGSSMGINICKTYQSLVDVLEKGTHERASFIVEEFIKGKEATVGVINNFRNKKVYTLPPIEIRIPKTSTFFDNEAKYSGKSKEICPGNFKEEEKQELERLAGLIHKGFDLSHYSRSDFIVHPKRGIYALEVNTLPGLTRESLMPKALDAVGSNMPEFIEHIIKLTKERK